MATYKHLRSSTAHKRPTTSLADGQLAINTNTASPGLFFKDSAGTGIVKVGPVHVGTTAPNSSPAVGGSSGNYLGEQWLDTSVSPVQMKVWNGSAWVAIVADELPVSKLQDGAAGQIIQTDSAGTGVEWSSTTNLPVGSAGTPAYSFQSDSNTGIYSPGADQVAISTNGTGRLFVDSSGDIGIGVSAPGTKLHIVEGSGTGRAPDSNAQLMIDRDVDSGIQIIGGTSNYARIFFGDIDNGTIGRISYNNADNSLAFNTNASERLRITSDGKLGLGTDSPSGLLDVFDSTAVDAYFGKNADSVYIKQDGPVTGIQFGSNRPGLTGGNRILQYSRTSGDFQYLAGPNGSETAEITIDSTGQVGIGTTSPDSPLHVYRQTSDRTARFQRISSQYIDVIQNSGINAIYSAGKDFAIGTTSANPLTFRVNDSEAARIDSFGRVGIGITNPAEKFVVSNGGANGLEIKPDYNTNNSLITSYNRSGDAYTDLTFSADAHIFSEGNAERARIDSSGRLLVGTSTSVSGSAGATNIQVAATSSDQGGLSLFRSFPTGTPEGTAYLQLCRNGGSNVGDFTAVASGSRLGLISFDGADGTAYKAGAYIYAEVDGTPGTNDMPGRLVFSVTADGASSPTEALRISNDRSITVSDGGDVVLGTTTGTKIGTATSQKIGFYNATPVVQPTTGVAEAAFVENSGGTAVNVDSTFGGYTIQQVVEALQTLGLLA